MDIERINRVLTEAIVGLQDGEVDALVGFIHEFKRQKRKTFVVYRIGSPSEPLDGRNAANIRGLVNYIDIAFERQYAHGEHVTAYRVTVDLPFGTYQAMQGGPRATSEKGRHVGRQRRPSGVEWYSFPPGGAWKAKKIKSITLDKLSQLADPKTAFEKPWNRPRLPYWSWDKQAGVIRDAFGLSGR